MGEDSVSGLPGVHLYVPKIGRGTTTNVYGYFSVPFLSGDSVVVSFVGYEKQHFIVPDDQGDKITMVITLTQDMNELPLVEVFPFPSEEMFKEAILAMKTPEEESYSMRDLYGDEAMEQMLRNTPYDGAMNFRYYQDVQFNYTHGRLGYVQNPFLNPFNWANFIKDLKKKKDKTPN